MFSRNWLLCSGFGTGSARSPCSRSRGCSLGRACRPRRSIPYWANLCRLLAEAEKFDEAIEACDEAILVNQRDPFIWSDRSFVLWNLERHAEAIASADEAIALRADFSEAYTWRCTAFSGLERDEDAIDSCEQALLLDSNWRNASPAEAWYLRGEAMLRSGFLEEAVISYDRALLVTPEDSQFLARKCEALTQLEQPLAAIAACDEALAIDNNWRDPITESLAWRNRATALEQVGGEEQAIAALDQALSNAPKDEVTWTQQEMLLERRREYADALIAYEQAVTFKEDYTLALVNLCAVRNKLGLYEAALEACQLALDGDATWDAIGPAEAWNELTVTLTNLGRFDEALAAANRAVGFRPDYAQAWNHRGVLLWHPERYEESLSSFQRALDLNPRYAEAWLNRGRLLQSRDRPFEALSAFDQAAQWAPQNASVWANRSAALWSLGQYGEALTSAQRATALDPDSFLGWYGQAKAAASLGNVSLAV